MKAKLTLYQQIEERGSGEVSADDIFQQVIMMGTLPQKDMSFYLKCIVELLMRDEGAWSTKQLFPLTIFNHDLFIT